MTGIPLNECLSQDTGVQETFPRDSASTQLQAGCQFNGPIVCTRMPSVEKRLQEIKEDLREGLREDLKEDLEKHLKKLCTQILHEKMESMKLDSSSASSVSATERKLHPTPPLSSRNCDALTSSGFSSPSGSSSSLLVESMGSQTPECLKRSSCSDSECMKRVMMKRKPKLSNVQKAHSASDAVSGV